jgi:flagellar biosynthetic protein FlhB
MGARWFASEMAMNCGGMLAVVAAVGLLTGFLQVGFVISARPMELDWGKMSPAKGWQRILSTESMVRGVLGAMKVSVLLIVSATVLWFRRNELSVSNFSTVRQLLSYGWDLGLTICLTLAAVLVCLASIDYLARWMRQEEKLKMTRDEIKREMKEEFGDPTVKAAVRRMQREAVKQRSVADVPKATVVITNPTHLAIAIQYDQGTMSAPKVVAKGADAFAKNIIAIARNHKIPVIERKPLARAIFKSVAVGQEIPQEFFRAIAEILAQIYRLRRNAV